MPCVTSGHVRLQTNGGATNGHPIAAVGRVLGGMDLEDGGMMWRGEGACVMEDVTDPKRGKYADICQAPQGERQGKRKWF